MVRNVESKGLRSDGEFTKYINRLQKSEKKSEDLLKKTKKQVIIVMKIDPINLEGDQSNVMAKE